MDTTGTITKEKVQNVTIDADTYASERLEMILAENARFERRTEYSDADTLAASLMKNPVNTETAVARLGLLTGAIPTSALFIKVFIMQSKGGSDFTASLAIGAMIAVSICVTSTAGYMTGKAAGQILQTIESKNWPGMMLLLPFIGAAWGLLSGAAGGIVLLGIGAVFGGAIGLAVGALIFTAFGILHRLLKTTDQIEQNRLLPISIGLVSIVAAFILGA